MHPHAERLLPPRHTARPGAASWCTPRARTIHICAAMCSRMTARWAKTAMIMIGTGRDFRCASTHFWAKTGGIAVHQTLPWEVQVRHCGRSGNRTHLAFEICEDGLDDRAYFTAVYRPTVELTAICRRFGLDPLGRRRRRSTTRRGNRRGIASAHGDGALVPAVWEDHGRFSAETAALLRRLIEKEAEDLAAGA